MHLFTYANTSQLSLLAGSPVENYDSVMWVERYRGPGSFEIKAPLSSGLKNLLPLGSIVSHTDTLEFAVVENQEITESLGGDPVIVVTGRTFDAFLDYRVVGAEVSYGSPGTQIAEYVIAAGYTHKQVYDILDDHVINTTNSSNSLSSDIELVYGSGFPLSSQTSQDARHMERQTVAEAIDKVLSIDDLGLKTIRKNSFGMGSASKSRLCIHPGENKSDSVIFSWVTGELESVSYLLSQKSLKNCALVLGTWIEEHVNAGSSTGYDRRMLLVDGKDIDEQYDAVPTGADLTNVRAAMQLRGVEALSSFNGIDIVAADISKLNQYTYRTDYNIGDIVSIDGSYGDIELRRVVEHVEIEDETGYTSYPTLALYEE